MSKMKFTAITDGGKYGVQPTMEKPKYHERMMMNFGYGDRLKEYESHLLARPRYLRTQGLELLPDGEEFEATLFKGRYKCPACRHTWPRITDHFCQGGKRVSKEEIKWEFQEAFLAPLVKDQNFYCRDWEDVGCKCDEQCERCKKAESMPNIPNPEPVEQEGLRKLLERTWDAADKYVNMLHFGNSEYVPDKETFINSILQSIKQSDAVEFAEWCSLNNYGCWGKDKWRNNAGELFTSEELYKLFTLK